MLAWPENGRVTIRSLGGASPHLPKEVANVELLGSAPVKWTRDAAGLHVDLGSEKPREFALALRISTR